MYVKLFNNKFGYPMLTDSQKKISDYRRFLKILDYNSFCELVVDVISSVLDRNDTSAFEVGDNGDGFAAVASEREQECIKLFVVGVDLNDDIFLAFFSIS